MQVLYIFKECGGTRSKLCDFALPWFKFFSKTEVEVGQHLRVREDGISLAAFLVIYLERDVWPNLSLFVCLARKPFKQKV